MSTEIVIESADRPGILATIGELFGGIDVNIIAAAAFTHSGKGVLHFVVDDADRAVASLNRSGFDILQVEEVLSVTLDDRPGELGKFARKLADAGINIKSFYTAGEGAGDRYVIFAVDNVEAARGL